MRKLLTSMSVLVALAAFLTLSSCGGPTIKQREVAAGSAFATCAKTELTQLVGIGSGAVTVGEVITKIYTIVIQGLTNWQAELDLIAAQAGTDLMVCIMDMVEAFINAQTPPTVATGSGSASTSASAVMMQRAQALDRLHVYKSKLAKPVAK